VVRIRHFFNEKSLQKDVSKDDIDSPLQRHPNPFRAFDYSGGLDQTPLYRVFGSHAEPYSTLPLPQSHFTIPPLDNWNIIEDVLYRETSASSLAVQSLISAATSRGHNDMNKIHAIVLLCLTSDSDVFMFNRSDIYAIVTAVKGYQPRWLLPEAPPDLTLVVAAINLGLRPGSSDFLGELAIRAVHSICHLEDYELGNRLSDAVFSSRSFMAILDASMNTPSKWNLVSERFKPISKLYAAMVVEFIKCLAEILQFSMKKENIAAASYLPRGFHKLLLDLLLFTPVSTGAGDEIAFQRARDWLLKENIELWMLRHALDGHIDRLVVQVFDVTEKNGPGHFTDIFREYVTILNQRIIRRDLFNHLPNVRGWMGILERIYGVETESSTSIWQEWKTRELALLEEEQKYAAFADSLLSLDKEDELHTGSENKGKKKLDQRYSSASSK
jgi:hypothetical protein